MRRVIAEEQIEGRDEAPDSPQRSLNRTARTRFTVLDTLRSATLTEDEIYAVPGVPRLYDELGTRRVRKRSIDWSEAHGGLYYVDVESDNQLPDFSMTGGQQPQDWRPDWDWDSEEVEEVQEVDAEDENKAIATAAGDPILVTRPRTIPILHISRLQLSFDPQMLIDWQNVVNSLPFWGWPAGTVLLKKIRDREENVSDASGQPISLRRVEYFLHFNNRKDEQGNFLGWDHYVQHQGEHYLSDANDPSSQKKFRDLDRQPRVGKLLPDGTPLPDGLGIIADYLRFRKFPKRDLNQLSLGPY